MPNSIVAEYQSQLWIMEPAALKAFVERLAGLPAAAQLPSIAIASKKAELNIASSIAKIPIKGVLLDKVPGWLRLYGIEATGYDEIVSWVNEAAGRDDVTEIMLEVDSPGGLVAGVMEAADSIFNARAAKPVNAVVQNLSASGAYWLSSQAQKITASDANSLIGSIGVYTYYVDWSGYESDVGIKTIVIRSGEHKGMGLDSITKEQIAAVQEYIDATADNFVSAVAQGRGAEKEKIAAQATGQLWIAKTAKKLGLIDSVTSARKQNNSQAKQTSTSSAKGLEMDEKQQAEQIKAATAEAAAKAQQSAQAAERDRMKSLQSEFGDEPDFVMKAFTEGWDIATAKAEFCDVLRQREAARKKDEEKAAAENAAAVASAGASAIATEDTDGGSDQTDFLKAARDMAFEKKITVTEAMRRIRRMNPNAHERFKDRCKTEGQAIYMNAG